MTSTTRRAGSQTIRNQALPAATASPGPQLTHPQPPRLNSYGRIAAAAFLRSFHDTYFIDDRMR